MPQQATPTASSQRIIVFPASRAVSVINTGPQGPAGPAGTQGEPGPTGPSGPGGGVPIATVIAGVWATAPAGYLFFGQSILNADTAYPALWSAVPAAWKVGTSLTLPVMTDRTLMETVATVGALAGSMTHQLAAASLPPHAHTMDHDHPAGTTGNQSANHTHSMAHDHGSFDTPSGGAHQHTQRYLTTATGSGSNADLARPGGATFTFTDISNAGDVADGAHVHSIDVPNYSGNTLGVSVDHQHSFDVAAFTGNTGNGPGTTTAINHTPAHMNIRFAIRAVP